ncbi:XrtA/PEP-CTERM system histidine kinase PrsK [Amphritea sp.]|uniref:XrtA/PEP-CTERM system histidine kinase PrsK n=1 Tax=Amphritea sp. TaxID=1872502 RepID=UPI0025B92AE6|nr:XrtA/PEP-CTERM system histidine kinase PrsK [Amphritea sp.]
MSLIAAYLSASIISVILAFVFIIQFYRRKSGYALTLAALFNSFWLFNLVPDFSGSGSAISSQLDLFFESMHYSIWILAISRSLPDGIPESLHRKQKWLFWFCWMITLSTFVTVVLQIPLSTSLSSLVALSLTVITLSSIEQLFRICRYDRQIKVLCISLGILLFYDLFYHSFSFIAGGHDTTTSQIRASVYLAACFMMAVGVTLLNTDQNKAEKSHFQLSHTAAFYTSTLVTSALFITLVFLGGYYVKVFSDEWSTIAYIFISFSVVFLIVTFFASRQIRARIVVLINKHFFSHKYDYRKEWKRISDLLSQGQNEDGPYSLAYSILADTFQSPAGIIWIKSENDYIPVFNNTQQTFPEHLKESSYSHFCNRMLNDEWVFFPEANPKEIIANFNDELPGWSKEINDLWLLVPLITNNELVGFVALTRKSSNTQPTWEDLDLVKTIGSQLASYLKLHQQEEKIEDQRQLNLYNKLSSFVMHDLNNLIAQQDLVVKNAEKHIKNPAFVADTIRTVSNSVQRMKSLLFKLRSNKPEDVEKISVAEIIESAMAHSEALSPQPTFEHQGPEVFINADRDRLMMSISHLIKNAQDATPNTGKVSIKLASAENEAFIEISDTGKGMDQEFINKKLFKPFESTKSAEGMGIGVYLTRDYIQQLDGHISVSSIVGVGTTFSLTLNVMQR